MNQITRLIQKCNDKNAILDMLYESYISYYPIEHKDIQKRYLEIDNILSKLSLDDNNSVFELTCTLCEEYAKSAFSAGVYAGCCLHYELSDKVKNWSCGENL